MKKPLPELRVRLQPSRLADGLALALVVAAVAAALIPGLPVSLRIALPLLAVALVLDARRDLARSGVCELGLRDGGEVLVVHRDGRRRPLPGAGYAQIGMLAVFVFVVRADGTRWAAPERITVWRDAVGADEFRRLRARLRMA